MRPISPEALAGTDWTFSAQCPKSWAAMLSRCGGGFFHTPPGLLAGSPPGEPMYLSLGQGARCMGVALGVLHTSHRSLRSRIGWEPAIQGLYFPTLPAFAPGVSPDAALSSLEPVMQTLDVASARFDSFDATWCPNTEAGSADEPQRSEYVMDLTTADEERTRLALCNPHHRRHIRHGDSAGWTLRRLHGPEAQHVLGAVLLFASARSAQRGDAFAAASPTVAKHAATDLAQDWGIVVWSVWDAAGPLAAAAVGYANGTAFYISGGSTPRGYAMDASIWMHWRIGTELAAAGFRRYNLGGTPASACDPHDAAHGLYRFKRGFGVATPTCSGVRWSFADATERAAPQWLGGSGRG